MAKDLESGWKCDCGHVEYGDYPPEECNNCWKMNGFSELSDEMIESLRDSVLKNIKTDDFEDEEEEE